MFRFIRKYRPLEEQCYSDCKDLTTVEVNIDATDVSLDSLCYEFDKFLRGCGYAFQGEIGVIREEE